MFNVVQQKYKEGTKNMNIPRSVWWLVIGMALNITGSSFLWPLNTIYMKEELSKSLTIAAIVLMVNSFGMVVGNLLGGSLFDKLGGYRTIMIGTVTCLISTTLLNFFHGWPWYAVWLVLLGFGGGMIVPAIYAMAGAVWPNGENDFQCNILSSKYWCSNRCSYGWFRCGIKL